MSTTGVVESDFGGIRDSAMTLDGLVGTRSSIELMIMRIRIQNSPSGYRCQCTISKLDDTYVLDDVEVWICYGG
jgi:hypothetical protein